MRTTIELRFENQRQSQGQELGEFKSKGGPQEQ